MGFTPIKALLGIAYKKRNYFYFTWWPGSSIFYKCLDKQPDGLNKCGQKEQFTGFINKILWPT